VVIDVGPLDSPGVLVWTALARKIVRDAENDGEVFGLELPPDVITDFARYVEEWNDAAEQSPQFRWTADVDPDVAVYLVNAFYRLAERMAAAAVERGHRLFPDEARPFYWALVSALLNALEAEGPPRATFAESLREFWPGLADGT
jgi:hypothetical protein